MKKQWADGPLTLIESPRNKALKGGKPQTGADELGTEMCLVHNAMIRGVNTMLNQANYVTSPADIKDFMEYAISFCVMIHEHHECEEVLFFPMIENATGVPGILDRNVVQHEEFLPKIHDFDVYCKQVRLEVRNYDAKKFVELIEAFGTLLTTHLTDEIDSFKQLNQYNLDWDAVVKRLVDYAVAHAHKTREIPFILHNADLTWENGIHVDKWPPLPGFIQLYFRWVYFPTHKGAWRFGSCDAYGRPRELAFAPAK